MAHRPPVELVYSSSEKGGDMAVRYGPVRSNRQILLLLDSEGYRCRRAAVLDITGDVRAGRLFRGEDRSTSIARLRSEYEALGWVRTSLLWRGTRRIKRRLVASA